jgi:two-component system C4-dicarboxylate transport response regulator DctD
MPGIDGQQVFEAARAINGQLPVLLMSGFSESEATAKFAGQGLAGFIQNPFEISVLVGQLSRAIQSRRG